MKKLPRLDELLQYKNTLVIKRFSILFPQFKQDAEKIFEDMLSYLWLCKKFELDKSQCKDSPELNFTCVMHKEMEIIDEMWHAFILVTVDYANFCEQYFGEFLHHLPEMGEEIDKNFEVDTEIFRQELSLFLSYIYDNLGENTLKRWFSQYLEAYQAT